MECNKRNSKIRYAIFRDSNLNQISNVQLNQTRSFPRTFVIDLANFLGPLFFNIFGRFVKTKCRTFLRMALQCFNRIQITSI